MIQVETDKREVMPSEAHAPLHVYLRDEGQVLATRDRGRALADRLRTLAEEPGDIILDFEGVEAATPPFLQEVIDALHDVIYRESDTGRIVFAVNMNDDLAESMTFVLNRRKAALLYRSGDILELLGESSQLAETLRQAQQLRSFTAPELAEKLAINPSTANKRLEKLLEAGAVRRERDTEATRGIRHIYHAALPS
jgi:DNA-binding transcriptional ArsR family regulator